ncbi:hypothetical protein HNR42_002061 [Deinobacterium chartae]|uniref:Peptidase S9 prolyl oligopeptidase catalytic domain-containing protein n=1 Tax=Deinobacterium chartae TaxID=521158 RepID=A0A841I0K0_9DEIO|nr:prolyl oligopeptidase family serine peptidase [Deinobacterium chartae]MBB6098626.1 hypothetical protein [Deinobacterium chartae]
MNRLNRPLLASLNDSPTSGSLRPSTDTAPGASGAAPGPLQLPPALVYDWLGMAGKAQYRAADLGESLHIARSLMGGDPTEAIVAYEAMAERLLQAAQNSLSRGHRISARDAFLRASNYAAATLDFLDAAGQADRFLPLWTRHRDSFDQAVALFDPPAEHIEIPYEGTTLPGYFIRPDDARTPRPLLILNNGSDGSVLSMWTSGGAAAIERGYHILIFDGPGQGAALFRQQLYFRPDWEKVITPVVEYALGRPEVDPNRIALQGISQGGYWVPRALAFEHRIAAAIADPGVVDVSSSWLENLPEELRDFLHTQNKAAFDAAMTEYTQQVPEARATLAFRMRPYGMTSFYDVFQAVQAYTLRGLTDRIRCPLLVTDPAREQFWPGQSRQLYDALTCPKTLVPFTAEDGSDLHCEPQALAVRDQRIFDWLDEVLG